MSSARLWTMDSRVAPDPPPLSLGWMFVMVFRTSADVLVWYLVSISTQHRVINRCTCGSGIEPFCYVLLFLRDVSVGMQPKHLW